MKNIVLNECHYGQGVHWPDIDEDINIEGMLYGAPARRHNPISA